MKCRKQVMSQHTVGKQQRVREVWDRVSARGQLGKDLSEQGLILDSLQDEEGRKSDVLLAAGSSQW